MATDPSLLKFDADTASAEKKLADLRTALRQIATSVDTDQARAELSMLEKSLDGVEVDLKQARVAAQDFGKSKLDISGVQDAVGKLRGAWSSFLAIFGVTSIAAIGAAAIKTAGDFEQLEARLFTLTGSAKGAADAFDLITQFAAKTPFQVQEITDAFARLKAQGVEPTEKILKSVGDTAAANGKSFLQFTEALLDAQTGQFERLKEFGIVSRTEGEKVSFTFRGVTTEVEKSAKAIRGYLLSIGETQFAGAMERQSKTLFGAFSNLQDAVSLLSNKLGKSGLSRELNLIARDLAEVADSGGKAGRSANDIGKAMAFVVGSLKPLSDLVSSFFRGVIGGLEGIGAKIIQAGAKMVSGFAVLADAVGLDSFSKKLANASADAKAFGDSLEEVAFDNVDRAREAFDAAGSGFSALIDRLSETKEATKGAAEETRGHTATLSDNKKAVDDLLPKLKELAEGKRAGAVATQEQNAALKEELALRKQEADAAGRSQAEISRDVESKKKRISELDQLPVRTIEQDEELFRLKGELFEAEQKLAQATEESIQKQFEYGEAAGAAAEASGAAAEATTGQAAATDALSEALKKAADAQKEVDAETAKARDSLASANEIIETVGENGERKFTNLKDAAGQFGEVMVKVGEDGETVLTNVGDKAQAAAESVQGVADAATTAAEKVGEVGTEADAQVAKVDDLAAAWDRATEAVERYREAVERANAAVRDHESLVDDGGSGGEAPAGDLGESP